MTHGDPMSATYLPRYLARLGFAGLPRSRAGLDALRSVLRDRCGVRVP